MSTESIKELVSEFVIKEKTSLNELNSILIIVKNKKENFIEMLKELEQFTYNQNDIIRKNSLRLISLVIERVSCLELSESEMDSLLEFSIIKLKDVVCAQFAVKTIYRKF